MKPKTRHSIPTSLVSHPRLLTGAYIVAAAVTELILHYLSTPWGVVLCFVSLISLVSLNATDPNDKRRDLWLALGLVPMIRIITVMISLSGFTEITQYVLVGAGVLLGIYTVSQKLNYALRDVGLNGRHVWIQILVAMTGVGLGIIGNLILRPEPLATGSFLRLVFPALVLLLFTGLVPELAFRGVIQRAAMVLGSQGWLLVALLYAALHIGTGSRLHLLFILAVALYFGLVAQKTKSVVGTSAAHGLLNIVLFLAMPNSV